MRYYLSPNPNSNEKLLAVLVGLSKSNLVSRILGIGATIHIDLNPPYNNSYSPIINLSTPLAYGYHYYYDFDYECGSYTHEDYKKFPIQSDNSAKGNKTFNLNIEPEDKAETRLKNCLLYPKYRSIYLLPSGLNGIQKILGFINEGFVHNSRYIGQVVEFAIESYVLWDAWIRLVETNAHQEILKKEDVGFGLDNESITILIVSKTKTIEFGQNAPEKSLAAFIKENWTNKYTIKSSCEY
ncbi:MAG: hypothetical protein ACFFCI_21765 [Promethearchaeota archaeon]